MNIGDQVRALHGNDDGFITKIIDENTIEIEIEDGFTIVMLKKDVVVVKREEADYFDKSSGSENVDSQPKKVLAHIGIYLAFIPSSENFVDLQFINNTDYRLLITAHSVSASSTKGEYSGIINSKSFVTVGKWNIKNFEQWHDLHIDALFYQHQSVTYKSPLSKKIKFQAKSFFNSFKQTPLVEEKGYVYQLDQNHVNQISPSLVMRESKEMNKIDMPEEVIDLHGDQLPDFKEIPKNQILSHQLELFQNKLETAISMGMSEITFIHGNGNGVLKQKIHKQLSNHPHIAYFQDAQKNKFGYGATYAKIK